MAGGRWEVGQGEHMIGGAQIEKMSGVQPTGPRVGGVGKRRPLRYKRERPISRPQPFRIFYNLYGLRKREPIYINIPP